MKQDNQPKQEKQTSHKHREDALRAELAKRDIVIQGQESYIKRLQDIIKRMK